jgi:hypothetical protein
MRFARTLRAGSSRREDGDDDSDDNEDDDDDNDEVASPWTNFPSLGSSYGHLHPNIENPLSQKAQFSPAEKK